MKKLIIIILTLTAVNVYGQNILIGVKAGINQTNMYGESLSYKPVNKIGFSGGITTDYSLFKFLSIGVDVNYEQRGFNDTLFAHSIDEGQPQEKFPFTESYNYISIPVKVSFIYGDNLYGFGSIGLVTSYLISAKKDGAAIPEYLQGYIGKFYGDITKARSTIDFAGLAEVGLGYKFNNTYWLYTAFSIQKSFTTILENGDIYHEGIGISLGVKKVL